MATTFTQLRSGNWGLRSTEALSAGSVVTVAKRDGTSKSATVGNPVWAGNGIFLYAIAPRSTGSDRPARRSTSGRRTGCSCGSREDAYGDLIPSECNCASCEHDAW